jgi:hypothetical protein
MKYRKRTDGSLVTKSQLKSENTNTSLPKTWTADTLEFLGVDPVLAGLKPAHDVDPELDPRPLLGDYEVAVADGAVKDGDNWVEAWKVQPMFAEYVDEDGKAVSVEQQIADYEAQKLLKKRQGLSATNENLRLQLDQIGVYGVMSAAVVTLDATAEANGVDVTPYAIHWGFATTINRLDEWVNEVAKAANVTDEQLDELFSKASEKEN